MEGVTQLAVTFAKPNPMINTDLLIISCNYLSLICEAEILCLPHFYLKRQFLYRISLIEIDSDKQIYPDSEKL